MIQRLEYRLSTDRPLIMGILNMTPDSFSDGGLHRDPNYALIHAAEMVEEGADIIDVGGESTRPGSSPVPPDEQCRRIVPSIVAIREKSPAVCLSVDTMSSKVAQAALSCGVVMINDVSAGEQDPAIFSVVAEHGAYIVLMHKKGDPLTMQDGPVYENVVSEVSDYLRSRIDAALGRGISENRIVLDPGIGFGKTRAHNLALLRNLKSITEIGLPVLLGCSRKRFMGALCNESLPSELLGATVATTALAVRDGVKLFRVHDVKANRQAADLAWHLQANAD